MTPQTETFNCAHCNALLNDLKLISPEASLRPNDIILCGMCGQVNTINPDMKCQPMLQDEFKKLSEVESRDLLIAMHAVIHAARKANRKHIIVPPWMKN